MSYLRFNFPFARTFPVVIALILSAANAQAAEWPACEKAKLQQLRLQKPTSNHKTSKRKSSRNESDRRQREEEIDTWLWKNCREFSYELRQLEQENM